VLRDNDGERLELRSAALRENDLELRSPVLRENDDERLEIWNPVLKENDGELLELEGRWAEVWRTAGARNCWAEVRRTAGATAGARKSLGGGSANCWSSDIVGRRFGKLLEIGTRWA
jgi:hypothetical protein